MIVCVDVDYRPARPGPGTTAVAACVVLPTWTASLASAEHLCRIDQVADYVPGRFYERELPCVLAILDEVEDPVDVVVVDGYVFLDASGTQGLGWHLYEALERRVPVIGVAKSALAGAPPRQVAPLRCAPFTQALPGRPGLRARSAAIEVRRGESTRPLYVTAIGVDPATAAKDVHRMHGSFRLPTMLKRVDRLCRDG